jgi:TetR/AcrR family transcriptional regulator
MQSASQPVSRRERNKQAKLERIIAAASELFSERGIDDVTTQQIADKADIGTGTLFLYAKTKGELLLMVQNSAYANALATGAADAAGLTDPLDAVMAIIRPVVECNRAQIENGRTYLLEMVFGDPHEPHHHAALSHAAGTESAIADVLQRGGRRSHKDAATLAHVISSIMFLSMAASTNSAWSVQEVLNDISEQVRAILPRAKAR